MPLFYISVIMQFFSLLSQKNQHFQFPFSLLLRRNDPSLCETDFTQNERLNLSPTGFFYEIGKYFNVSQVFFNGTFIQEP